MPRIFSPEMLDESALQAFDENEDPYSVPPSAFQYLPPPELGGPVGAVRVAVRPSQVGQVVNQPSVYEQYVQDQALEPWRVQHAEHEAKLEALAATLAAAIAGLGATRIYIRYDGGNDEGFAWFDHCELRDKSKRSLDQVIRDLEAAGVQQTLGALGDRLGLNEVLNWEIPTFWASKLLGEGFGTGEYVMYGAFWVDLDTGVVVDDVNPTPVMMNIPLKAE